MWHDVYTCVNTIIPRFVQVRRTHNLDRVPVSVSIHRETDTWRVLSTGNNIIIIMAAVLAISSANNSRGNAYATPSVETEHQIVQPAILIGRTSHVDTVSTVNYKKPVPYRFFLPLRLPEAYNRGASGFPIIGVKCAAQLVNVFRTSVLFSSGAYARTTTINIGV